MRKCDCGSGCSCRIVAGDGIQVTGAGSSTDPLVVTATITNFTGSIVGATSDTVQVTVSGSGIAGYDPFIITATTVVSMTTLTDVDDPSGPNVGDVPVWNGSAFEFAPPPTVAPGTVYVGAGLDGDGSFSDPILAAVSELVEDSTDGLGIYVDTDGKLRAVMPDIPDVTLEWSAITGKPTAFPTTWSLVSGRPTISTAAPSGGSDGDAWWRYVA